MTDALWSVQEVRTQAEQVPGQLDVWDCLQEVCTCAADRSGVVSSPCAVHGGES